jgi:hypothetical protein
MSTRSCNFFNKNLSFLLTSLIFYEQIAPLFVLIAVLVKPALI